jgi:hypothetical protein
MLMELVMLGVTDIDAEGNIFPELALSRERTIRSLS